MLKNHLQLFTSPDDATGRGGTTTTLPADGNKEDVIEFLSADDDDEETIPLEKTEKAGTDKTKEKDDKKDDKTPPKVKVDGEDEEEEEIDELTELEQEIEEPSEEQLELVTPVRRREILKKYPNVFKDFPYLEKAYYREQQFTELLPTIADAKVAVEKSEILDRFEGDVMKGNTENILKAVKTTDPDAFARIVDDYLPTLARVDQQSYFHILGNISKHTIYAMVQEANKTGDTTLRDAAQILNKFVFGTTDWKPPTNLSREEKPEESSREKQLSEREQGFIRQQLETSVNDLNTRVNNTLRNTIEANIDPKESMTEYVRGKASRDAIETLETLINQDTRFKVLVDKLWEAAYKANFTRESVDRIRSAYVSKAKTLLPSVIKKARNEALRGIGKRVRDDSDGEDNTRRGPVTPGRPRSQSTSSSGKAKTAGEIPKGMSTLEFLNQE